MKLLTIFSTIALAITVNAATGPSTLCSHLGEDCRNLERAVESVIENLSKVSTPNSTDLESDPLCYFPDQPCNKVKRAAEAFAKAAIDALAVVDPEVDNSQRTCALPGQSCSEQKTITEAEADAWDEFYKLNSNNSKREAKPEPAPRRNKFKPFLRFCPLPGQSCT